MVCVCPLAFARVRCLRTHTQRETHTYTQAEAQSELEEALRAWTGEAGFEPVARGVDWVNVDYIGVCVCLCGWYLIAEALNLAPTGARTTRITVGSSHRHA